jgi:hypothetical protein
MLVLGVSVVMLAYIFIHWHVYKLNDAAASAAAATTTAKLYVYELELINLSKTCFCVWECM